MQYDSLIIKKSDTEISTLWCKFRLMAYQQTTNERQVHLALTKGSWTKDASINKD